MMHAQEFDKVSPLTDEVEFEILPAAIGDTEVRYIIRCPSCNNFTEYGRYNRCLRCGWIQDER